MSKIKITVSDNARVHGLIEKEVGSVLALLGHVHARLRLPKGNIAASVAKYESHIGRSMDGLHRSIVVQDAMRHENSSDWASCSKVILDPSPHCQGICPYVRNGPAAEDR